MKPNLEDACSDFRQHLRGAFAAPTPSRGGEFRRPARHVDGTGRDASLRDAIQLGVFFGALRQTSITKYSLGVQIGPQLILLNY